MTSKYLIAAALAIAFVHIATGAAEAKTRAHNSQTKVLKKKVVKLEAQVASLRKQARTLSVALVRAVAPMPLLIAAIKVPAIVTVSRGFSDIDLHEQPREFPVPARRVPLRLPQDFPDQWGRSTTIIVDRRGHVIFAADCKHDLFPPHLMTILNDNAAHFGRPVFVTSCERDPERNKRARGASDSRHLPHHHDAADYRVEGVSISEQAAYAWKHRYVSGLGIYKPKRVNGKMTLPFVHVDLRPMSRKVVWSNYTAAQARALIGANDNVHIASYGARKKRHASTHQGWHSPLI